MIHQARFKRGATSVSNSNESDPKSHGNSTAVVSNVEFNSVAPKFKRNKTSQSGTGESKHLKYTFHIL